MFLGPGLMPVTSDFSKTLCCCFGRLPEYKTVVNSMCMFLPGSLQFPTLTRRFSGGDIMLHGHGRNSTITTEKCLSHIFKHGSKSQIDLANRFTPQVSETTKPSTQQSVVTTRVYNRGWPLNEFVRRWDKRNHAWSRGRTAFPRRESIVQLF